MSDINLSLLETHLQNQAQTGTVIFSKSNLEDGTGITLTDSLDTLLATALFPIKNGSISFLSLTDADDITFTLSGDSQTLTLKDCKISFLGILGVPATCVFTADNTAKVVNLSINTVPADWSLDQSFPALAGVLDDIISMASIHLIFSTAAQENFVWDAANTDNKISLTEGLNFVGQFELTDIPRVHDFLLMADSTFTAPTLTINGSIQSADDSGTKATFPKLNLTASLTDSEFDFGILKFKSPSISIQNLTGGAPSVFLNLKILIGETPSQISLDVKASLISNLKLLRVVLTTGGLTIENVFDIIPGGKDVWDKIPSDLAACLEDIAFYSFAADFALGTPKKISSLQTAIGSTTELALFDDFKIDSFDVNWLCMNPGSDNRQHQINFNAQFEMFEKFLFDVSINKDMVVNGSCSGFISLSDLITIFNDQVESADSKISCPFDVSLGNFTVFLDKANSHYTFGATANASLKIMNQDILEVKNTQISVDVTKTGPEGAKVNHYEVKLSGMLEIMGLDFSVSATVGNGATETVIKIQMMNKTLGDLLSFIVKLISGESEVTLPFPWSALNDINMSAFVLEINATKESVSLEYTEDINIDFIDLSNIKLTSTKNQTTGIRSTLVSLDCSFFGKSYGGSSGNKPMAWDPVNGNPPSVPSNGSVLNIRYLGMGQHISFDDTADTSTMQKIIENLENIAVPPPRPLVPGITPTTTSVRPLESLPSLKYNADSGWFIAGDITILDAISIGVVFNDPELYGVIIAVAGEKFKLFDGLQFEILYRKINDSIGEYYLELKLPTEMRHLEFGEVSVTLPVIGISIYTNGNFELDFGFPWNNDFSRSFGLQVFPFVGAGGFYFGVLDGATSSQVPAITNGSFDPVIVFGFGLQVGVGKSIDEGVLSASLEVTVAGIIQGVLGFFKPDDTSLPSETYYKLQGTVAIGGVLSGSVDFAIIKATVLVRVYAMARITYECHQPIHLGLDVGVSVEVSVKVAFINIHFSFSMTISKNFTIGSASPTPWVLAPVQPATPQTNGGIALLAAPAPAAPTANVTGGAPASPDFGGARANSESLSGGSGVSGDGGSGTLLGSDGSGTVVTLNWETSNAAYFTTASDLDLHFVPTPTVLDPTTSSSDNNIGLVGLLFVENSLDPESTGVTPFNKMVETTLAWALKSGAVSSLTDLTESNATERFVSYADLQTVYTSVINNKAPSYDEISKFLANNFTSLKITPSTGTETTDITASVFPMIPDLSMSWNDGADHSVDFSTKNETGVNAQYVADIATYLSAMSIQTSGSGQVSFEGDETKSYAKLVFINYFELVLRASVQAAQNILKLLPYTVKSSPGIQAQLSNLGVSFTPDEDNQTYATSFQNFSQANKDVIITTGTSLDLKGMHYTIQGSEATNLDSIGTALLGDDYTSKGTAFLTSFLEYNLFTSNVLLKDSELSIDTLSYIIPDNTKSTIKSLFNITEDPAIQPTAIAHDDSDTVYEPFLKLSITGGSFTPTSSINTINLIAFNFNIAPSRIVSSNKDTLSGKDYNEALDTNNPISLPDFTYTVLPDTQYGIASYFGVSTDKVAASSFVVGQTATITGLKYTIPSDTNLSSLGHYLNLLDCSTLLPLILSQSIISPGALAVLPSLSYTTLSNDTPDIICQKYDLSINELVNDFLITLFPEGTVLNIPDAKASVSDLMTALTSGSSASNCFNNIAGLTSRFLLHGLRLPDANPVQEIVKNGTVSTDLNVSGIYELIGQQFDPGTAQKVTLTNTNTASWLSFPGGGDTADCALTGTVATNIAALKAAETALQVDFIEYDLYNETKPQFTLQNSINWMAADPPAFIESGSVVKTVTTTPTIWLFSQDLNKKLQEKTSAKLSLYTGTRDASGQNSMTTKAFSAYRWATMLTLKVKQIPSTSSKTGNMSYVYQITGLKNESERHMLTKLIEAYKDTGNVPSVELLYVPDSKAGNTTGLQSDHLTKQTSGDDIVRVVKSNLSTILPPEPGVEILLDLPSGIDGMYLQGSTDDWDNTAPVLKSELYPTTGDDQRNSWVITIPIVTASASYSGFNWAKADYAVMSLDDNIQNATGIRFWAKGDKGGEIVNFGITPIRAGFDAPGAKESDFNVYLAKKITLTDSWQLYEINFEEVGWDFNSINPVWYEKIKVPFDCSITGALGNADEITFAIDSSYGIQFYENETVGHELVEAGISEGYDFLKLIWESSLIKTGGFFLQYQNGQGNGLPASLFSQSTEGQLKILALCPTDTSSVSDFHNSVVLKEAVDTSTNVLFAQADDLTDYIAAMQPGYFGISMNCEMPAGSFTPKPTLTTIADIANEGFAAATYFGGDDSGVVNETGGTAQKIADSKGVEKTGFQWKLTSPQGGVTWTHPGAPTKYTMPTGANRIYFWIKGTAGTTMGIKGWDNSTAGVQIPLTPEWTRHYIKIDAVVNPITQAFVWLDYSKVDKEFAISIGSASEEADNGILYIDYEAAKAPTGDEIDALIQSYYSLLSCRIKTTTTKNFNQSVYTMPSGPVVQEGTTTGKWHFNKVFPVAQMAVFSDSNTPGFPDLQLSPYRAVGKKLDKLEFVFQDIFGNLAKSQAVFLPEKYQTVKYFDELIPVSQWPGVAASFDFTKGDSPNFNVYLHFDTTKYLPVSSKTLTNCQNRASNDIALAQSIFYQLKGPDVSINLKTSMNGGDALSQDGSKLHSLIGGVYKFLNTVGQIEQVTFKPVSGTNTLQLIKEQYRVTLDELAAANTSLATIFSGGATASINKPVYYTVKAGDTIKSICAAADPALTPLTWVQTLADQTEILKSGTKLIISTSPELSYTIQPTDTFNSIISVLGIKLEAFVTNYQEVADIFTASNQLLLSSTATIIPTDATTLTAIASAWGVTVSQLANVNADTALEETIALSIPSTYQIPTSIDASTYQVLALTESSSLSDLATAQNVSIEDIFLSNQGLLGVLDTNTPIKLPDYATAGSITPKENDTLLTVYNQFLIKIPGLTKAVFYDQIKSIKVFSSTSTILLPPADTLLTQTITANYEMKIFEITGNIEIARSADLIDSNVPAALTNVTSVSSQLSVHTTEDANGSVALSTFATKFEEAFENVKVAVQSNTSSSGSSGSSGSTTNTTQHVWAVPVVESDDSVTNAISYSLQEDSALFFAPAPLANQKITRNEVTLNTYQTAVGLTGTKTYNFSDIDMDNWGSQFLDALHSFMQATFALPASDLDKDSFQTIMDAKQAIAESIADSVIPILETDSPDLVQQQEAAKESMVERLLENIASAYDVSSIVQLEADVDNANFDEVSAPRLIGKPTLQGYTIKSSTDKLSTIASDAFAQAVDVTYLGEIIADFPGLIQTANLDNTSFKTITGITSQDSSTIFFELVKSEIITSTGEVKDGFDKANTSALGLSTAYQAVATIIADKIDKAQTAQSATQLTNGDNKIIPSATDTLNTLNHTLAYDTLDDFINAIKDETILAAKSLNIAWNKYQPTVIDTLSSISDRFSCTIGEIVKANLANENLLKEQANPVKINNIDCTIGADTTLENLLTQLSITVADFDTGTNASCIALANKTGLFKEDASAGILRTQDALSLSTANLALTSDNAYLTLLLEKGSDNTQSSGGSESATTSNENVFVDFVYKVNGIQQESGTETLPGFEDYSSLSFVIPFETSKQIRLEIPIPLRAVPDTPSLEGQSAKLPDATAQTLDEITNWSYSTEFSQSELSQDEAEVSVRFNAENSETTSSTSSVSNAGNDDLFNALAQFINIWPTLESDINLLPKLSESLPLDADAQKVATKAVKIFAQVVGDIAQKWVLWKEKQNLFQESQTGDYQCTIKEMSDGDESLQAKITSLTFDVPINAFPVLEVIDASGNTYTPTTKEITVFDYTTGQQKPVSEVPDYDFKFIEGVYRAFKNGSEKILSYSDAKNLSKRKLTLSNLNVVQTYNAWGAIAMSRNRDLITGTNTNPAFIYQTPWVRFVDAFTPNIQNSNEYNVTDLATVSEPSTANLEDHLSALFAKLLELKEPDQPNRIHQIKVSCQYAFTAGGSSSAQNQLVANVPVTMHPEYKFNIHDWEITETDASKQTFVQKLSTAITNWQNLNLPNTDGENVFYQFKINLLTGNTEVKRLLNFLIHNNSSNLPGTLSRTAMPLSFYIPDGYWDANQKDILTVDSFTERILAHYGADIYDVATAQIALSIYPDISAGIEVAENWTKRLLSGFSGVLDSIRGWTKPDQNDPFEYGGSTSLEKPDAANGGNAGPGAYFFRMITDQWFLPDPLTKDTKWPDPEFKVNNTNDITWTDWKPITGENGWAALLGPLQLEYRMSGGKPSYNSDGVQLALKVLLAYQAMQFENSDTKEKGAIYYAPKNTYANQDGMVDPYGVSNENNFSSYAGLAMLMEVLAACYANEKDAKTRTKISASFDSVKEIALGVKSYFKEHLLKYVEKTPPEIYTGGTYATGAKGSEQKTNTFTPGGDAYKFAVDVHTWGMSVMGIQNIDEWFADDEVTCYDLWQTVKSKAGYFVDGDTSKSILGVGYTDVPTADAEAAGVPAHEFIISAEWSFGAITMCRVIGQQYLEKSRTTGDATEAEKYLNYAADLFKDAESMTNGVRYLLLDTSRADQDIYAYFYANRRYDIPFGWYANRLDSLCSTAWGVMVANNYNPFMLAGSYEKRVIDPETYTVKSWLTNSVTQIPTPNPMTSMSDAGINSSLQPLVNFLVTNNTKNLVSPDSLYRTGMPLSFYVNTVDNNKNYWKQLSQKDSDVYDATYATYCTDKQTEAVAERTLVHYGVDIYDAATMQCALAIYPDFLQGINVAELFTKRLLSCFSIVNDVVPVTTENVPPKSTIRGWTNIDQADTDRFYYGKDQKTFFPETDNTGPGAFYFRSISDQYKLTDPLTMSDGGNWVDWKPITGENAWAALIGPLQVAYSTLGDFPKMDHEAVQLALKVLPCFEAMVSPNGGLFYCPWHMAENSGGDKADPFSLSNENNFSSFAGLTMLKQVLEANDDGTTLESVNTLLEGLESYFKSALYNSDESCFYTGGTFKTAASTNADPKIDTKFTAGGDNFKFAVDVHTWGCTVLGVERVDEWFDDVTIHGLWQTVKSRAGYFENGDTSGRILGVGYTDVPTDVDKPHESVISAEWTFGAINMCRVIASQYADSTSSHYNETFANSLLADAQSMMEGVEALLKDKESRDEYTQAYFYANRRYNIPFGWYANRIDSLCSTAWGIMMGNGFNPFVLGGGYDYQPSTEKIVRATKSGNKPSLELSKLRLNISDIHDES